jgi:hypothetical protein
LEESSANFREKNSQYDEINRQLRRQLDESFFMVEKTRKEGEFNVELMRRENESSMRLMREETQRVEAEKELLRAEFGKMKTFFEEKIH